MRSPMWAWNLKSLTLYLHLTFLCKGYGESSIEEWCIICFSAVVSPFHLLSVCTSISFCHDYKYGCDASEDLTFTACIPYAWFCGCYPKKNHPHLWRRGPCLCGLCFWHFERFFCRKSPAFLTVWVSYVPTLKLESSSLLLFCCKTCGLAIRAIEMTKETITKTVIYC